MVSSPATRRLSGRHDAARGGARHGAGEAGPRHPERAQHRPAAGAAADREGAERSLSNLEAVAPYAPGSPCEIKVEFKHTAAPDKLRFRGGIERVDARTIVSRADTWWEAWRQFFF